MKLYLEVYNPAFDLGKVVCNHGSFMMAPNHWNPITQSLERPLRLLDETSTNVSISYSSTFHKIVIVSEDNVVSNPDKEIIKKQVRRMLSLSEKDEANVDNFHSIHDEAKQRGFGRLFRSPSFFEDFVKSILLCNCTWQRTLSMASNLCKLELQNLDGRGKKRKKTKTKRSLMQIQETFPSAKEIYKISEIFLKNECKLGFRAKCIVELAKRIVDKKMKFDEFGDTGYECATVEQIHEICNNIKGIGPFVTSTVLMCNGIYHIIPADSETIRHLKEVHGLTRCCKNTIKKDVKNIYDNYAPFQCLAYWFEMVKSYESKCGKLSELNSSYYYTVSGSLFSEK